MPKIFLYLIILFSLKSTAQVCDGTFGANIFDSGDFGSGSDQVRPVDPGIAPGYIYTTNLPPEDGFYIIANKLNASQIYQDWLPIGDNSAADDGYMMVVNASFEPGLFYEELITDLCDGVLYEFSADIVNLIQQGSTGRIDPDVSFLLDDEVVYNSGKVPKNERWNTYGFTFTTEPGQTEIKLSLRNNAPGGLGNDLALDNITFRPCGSRARILPETIANICEDGKPIDLIATIEGTAFENTFIQWQQSFDGGATWVNLRGENGMTFRFDNLMSGLYYYRFLLADSEAKLANSKCRTFSNTKVINVIPKFVDVVDSVCTGLSSAIGDNLYFNNGRHIDTLQNIVGCDSIVTLDLTIVENNLKGILLVNDPSCTDLSDGSIELRSVSSKGPYDVKLNGEEPPTWFTDGLGDGVYQFQVEDRYGCNWDTLLTLTNPPPFTVDLGPDQKLQLGERFEINNFASDRAEVYQWNPQTIDCQPPCSSISEVFTESLTISLNAISDEDCEASDQVRIEIEPLYDLFIPNIITPNGDKKNDAFTVYPKGINSIESINELSVYNRYGKRVFMKNQFDAGQPEIGWSGIGDDEVSSGVYYYYASVKFINGRSFSYRGFVSVVR